MGDEDTTTFAGATSSFSLLLIKLMSQLPGASLSW